jgi:hypothetical protein
MLVKKLKSLSRHSNLLIFSNLKIYHHSNNYDIPLLMLDELRGLYIFEIKSWSYDDLKNATIEKAQNQASSKDTLSFDNTQEIIRKKFNELTHNDGVPIFNYLIMENLSADEYEHLNESFKTLLPLNKLIFSDSSESDIFKKLQKASAEDYSLQSTNNILGTLLIQYAILDEENDLQFCTQEQIDFLDKPLEKITYLNGLPASGKSTLLLLKSLVEILNSPFKKIIIVKPTSLACDIFKRKLLDIVEHAIVEVDLTSIEIVTPVELVNKHLQKLGKTLCSDALKIDESLMHKSFKVADIIMCDDTFSYPDRFVEYLQVLQKKSTLLLVNPKKTTLSLDLSCNFREVAREVYFNKTNPHAKSLHLVSTLLRDCKPEDILVVSNSLSREKLRDDLESFIESPTILLDSSQHLIYQNFNGLLLATYQDINALSAKYIIILDLCFTSMHELEYAINLATKSVYVLYEEDCQEITNLRNKYENHKE